MPVAPGQVVRVGAATSILERPVSYDPPPRKRPPERQAAGTGAEEPGVEDIPDEDIEIPPADVDEDWAEEDEA